MNKVLAAGMCVLLCCSGCGKKGKTVAVIGGDTITTATLVERIQEAPPGYQGYLTTPSGKKQFLDLMVRERVVLESARQAGVNKRSEYRKAAEEFKKEQARRARDYDENLLMEMFIKDLHAKQIAASDADVDKYFQEHKNEYLRPVEVMARHILVPTKQEAEKVLERLGKGEDFGKIAKEVSSDPISAVRGGSIGPFRRGDLVPEFEKAVFSLKPGQTSGVVDTQFGFHVIRKISEKALPARPEAEAKVEIKKMLEKVKFDAWLADAKKKLGVKVNYDQLSQVTVPSPAMMPSMQGQECETPAPVAAQKSDK